MQARRAATWAFPLVPSGYPGARFAMVGLNFVSWGATINIAADLSAAAAAQVTPRAVGALHLQAKRRGPDTVIADLRQQGSLKALFPKVRGSALDAVFLNTSGGLTGGDRMEIAVDVTADAHVVMTSQAAERAYRAQPGEVAHATVTATVAPGGRLTWVPQETILFDGAALHRRLDVQLFGDAGALLVEPVIFGRVAMGEVVHDLHLADHWRVSRNGALVFADAIRMTGDAAALMQRAAIGAGAGAMATVLLAGPQAEAKAAQLDLPDTSGKSLIADDLLLLRILATDGFALRKQLIPVIEALSDAPIPRVWRL